KDKELTFQGSEAKAYLKVETNPPGATVRLLGHADNIIGSTPLVHALEPGNYTVHIERDGYQARTQRLVVLSGETKEIAEKLLPIQGLDSYTPGSAEPDDDYTIRRTAGAGWALVATGGVLALGTGGLWLWADNTIDTVNSYDLTDPDNSRSERSDLEDQANNLKLATWVTGGAAALALTSGLVLLAVDNSEQAPQGSLIEGLTLSPTSDAEGGILMWGGRF
ncbi:MAG: PEGA domain-containing protein, partial [Myxococcota bacterium]